MESAGHNRVELEVKYDLDKKLVVITQATLEKLYAQENKDDLVALYFYYIKVAREQGRVGAYTARSFVLKELKWGTRRYHDARDALIRLGLIKVYTRKDKVTQRIIGFYVRVKFVWDEAYLTPSVSTDTTGHAVSENDAEKMAQNIEEPVVSSDTTNLQKNTYQGSLPQMRKKEPEFARIATPAELLSLEKPQLLWLVKETKRDISSIKDAAVEAVAWVEKNPNSQKGKDWLTFLKNWILRDKFPEWTRNKEKKLLGEGEWDNGDGTWTIVRKDGARRREETFVDSDYEKILAAQSSGSLIASVTV